ncbi:MAG: RluA family pseudouridine synthase [Planctomycetes bacterium]|nr:RluA family pseudouridine synthase [Planctomycetota bacterium]
MHGSLRTTVPAAAHGAPLVGWLVQRFTYFDAAAWRQEIAAGRLRRNGATASTDDRLGAGDVVDYAPPPPAPRPDLVLPILFDDADLVAIDKPAHLVAHRDGAFPANTFLHELERRVQATAPLHLVHRLDRETSGVLLLARHPGAAVAMQRQFEAGTVTKAYLAFVRGVVATDSFTVDAAVGPARDTTIAARRAVLPAASPGARAARTDFEVLERFPSCTLVRASPHTGRTHQIRVHLEHAGHPLVGDALYGRSDAEYEEHVRRRKAGEPPHDRQRLHAQSLVARHPTSGARLVLEAPMPRDFTSLPSAAAPARPSSPSASSAAPA